MRKLLVGSIALGLMIFGSSMMVTNANGPGSDPRPQLADGPGSTPRPQLTDGPGSDPRPQFT